MAYKRRDERPGYHHVVTRGNNKRDIFLDDRDRSFFLGTLDRVAAKYGWVVLAYWLMRNHYHVVLRIDERGLADGMCELNTAYATEFNIQHERINHLFGKRYWSEYLGTEARLLNAIRYVVQNPRRAGIAGPLKSHLWTSYRATIGLALGFARLACSETLQLFGTTPAPAIESFREYCEHPAETGHDRRQPP